MKRKRYSYSRSTKRHHNNPLHALVNTPSFNVALPPVSAGYILNLAVACDEVMALIEQRVQQLEQVSPDWRGSWAQFDRALDELTAEADVAGDAATIRLDRVAEEVFGCGDRSRRAIDQALDDNRGDTLVLDQIARCVAAAEADLADAVARRATTEWDRSALAGLDEEIAEYQTTVDRLREVGDFVQSRRPATLNQSYTAHTATIAAPSIAPTSIASRNRP